MVNSIKKRDRGEQTQFQNIPTPARRGDIIVANVISKHPNPERVKVFPNKREDRYVVVGHL